MSPTFRSLRLPNYRLWFVGAIVSNTGTWMQRVAQDWLVLTELTQDSGVALGITTGLQFAPMLLLAPVAGPIADRFDRRRILLATQSAMALLALVLGILVVTGSVRLWQVYLMAGALGVAAAIDGPSRQAFVTGLVPPDDLPNAIGLNTATFHLGRLIGPGIAGLLIHWIGTGPVFLVNAVSFVVVLFSLVRMDAAGLPAAHRDSSRSGGLREGLSYVRGRPDILVTLVVIGVVGTFGLKLQITMALMARLAFDMGAGQFGMLGSVLAIGSLAGALLTARRNRPDVGFVLMATLAFGVAMTVAAMMPTYHSFALALVPVGVFALMLMTTANSTVQMTTPAPIRGRVMALYMAVFLGSAPVGAPVVGWIGQTFGPRWSLLVGAAAAFVVVAGASVWWLGRPGRGSEPPWSPAEGGDDQEPQRQGHHEGQGGDHDRRRGLRLSGAVPLGEQEGVAAHRQGGTDHRDMQGKAVDVEHQIPDHQDDRGHRHELRRGE
jgi:MFS family permease